MDGEHRADSVPEKGRRYSDTGYCIASPRGLAQSLQASHKQPTMRDCVQPFFHFHTHTHTSVVCEGMMRCSLNPATAEARPIRSPMCLNISDRGSDLSPPSLVPVPIGGLPSGAEAPAIYRKA